MKIARPGGASGNGPGESKFVQRQHSTPPDSLANAPYDRPSIIERPVVPRRRHRERYHVRHVQHSLAGALVDAAIKSGKLERLKAAIREGQFDG